ncbi:MAG: alpha/beta hydrolase fold domain-containing protein [Actinobacteria bacterium]|nr:alpha/beta hydrolase fold domain-containing protein [Actinomycetota bacterium]
MNIQPYYDPEVRVALAKSPPFSTVNAKTLKSVRASRINQGDDVELSSKVTRTDIYVPGPPGEADVRLRVHKNVDSRESQPCLFWMHGGGYVLGTPEQDDLRFDRWCQRFGLTGVAVQYRLAPENPYPAGLNDAYAGLKWLKNNGEEIGVDSTRIGIGGPSAGAGLAAALGLLVRDRAEMTVDYQLLIYPMLDDKRASVTANWDVPIWNPESNEFGWRSYLGNLFDTDDVPTYAAPSRENDLSGLPPTYVMVGTLDGFADEDIAYAQRLNQCGVDTELHVYSGAPHGFDGFAGNAPVARRARQDINAWLEKRLK